MASRAAHRVGAIVTRCAIKGGTQVASRAAHRVGAIVTRAPAPTRWAASASTLGRRAPTAPRAPRLRDGERRRRRLHSSGRRRPHRVADAGGRAPDPQPCGWLRPAAWTEGAPPSSQGRVHVAGVFFGLFIECPLFGTVRVSCPPRPRGRSSFQSRTRARSRCCLSASVSGRKWPAVESRRRTSPRARADEVGGERLDSGTESAVHRRPKTARHEHECTTSSSSGLRPSRSACS